MHPAVCIRRHSGRVCRRADVAPERAVQQRRQRVGYLSLAYGSEETHRNPYKPDLLLDVCTPKSFGSPRAFAMTGNVPPWAT